MHSRIRAALSLKALAIVALVTTANVRPATADCLEWFVGPFVDYPDFPVNELVSFDLDGGGPEPTRLIAATDENVWKWDGANWRPLGTALFDVKALTIFQGSLVAAGALEDKNDAPRVVVRWNGNGWIVLGYFDPAPGSSWLAINALATYQGQLIAAGWFGSVDGVPAMHIARWNGSVWQPLGAGWPQTTINALKAFDPDGAGPNAPLLFAGGENLSYPYDFVANWNGSSWTDLTSPSGSIIEDFCEFDGELYAGGHYPPLGNFATLNRWAGGNSWVGEWALDGSSTIKSMTAWASSLVLGGAFQYSVGGQTSNNVLLWTEFNEFPLEPGWPCEFIECFTGGQHHVRAVCVHGTNLAVADQLTAVGQTNGFSWTPIDSPCSGYAIAVLGPRLVIGGAFTKFAPYPVLANNLAGWNGEDVTQIGGGTNGTVRALKSYVAGGENRLVVGGDFTSVGVGGGGIGDEEGGGPTSANRIALWTEPLLFGGGWEALGNGFNGKVLAVEWLPANQFFSDVIFAAGEFTAAGTGSPTFNRVASWSGSPAQWFTMGTGFNGTVRAIKGINSGIVNRTIVAGGDFTTASGISANHIAYYPVPNLNGWVAMGNGFNAPVHAIERYNNSWYAAGEFTMSGSIPVNRIARWTGTAWVPVGNTQGFNGTVRALMSSGGFLYAAGDFTSVDGISAKHVARYNGALWENAGPPWDPEPIYALATFHGEIHATSATMQSSYRRFAEVPWIMQQPASATVPCHTDHEFDVDLSPGYEKFVEFQWLKDGVPLAEGWTGTGSYLSNVTSEEMKVYNVSDADEGAYHVKVTTSCGSITSNAATLQAAGSCPPCPLDIAPPLGDGQIDVDDLLKVVNSWGPCLNCAADVAPPGGDDVVDVDDLLAIINGWGSCP